ncbi:MAG: MBL fold metallo-hydrolase [Proteobacteria bacterium]|nr:MBL fold metallo-hydrolase [Pseudomonadota bacterium]
MLVKQMIVGSMAVCCYLVICEETKKALIIDPGGNEKDILSLCQQQGVSVEGIINTHGHPDHVCGNEVLKKATGAPIIMHEADADFFTRPEAEMYFSMLGLPKSPPPDRRVKDGETISAGTISLKVIHTPGHSPGGMCLYSAPNLFTGDTLFVGAVGRSDFPGGDGVALIQSIKELLLVLPEETIVWPGHGYGGSRSTIGRETLENPFINGEM